MFPTPTHKSNFTVFTIPCNVVQPMNVGNNNNQMQIQGNPFLQSTGLIPTSVTINPMSMNSSNKTILQVFEAKKEILKHLFHQKFEQNLRVYVKVCLFHVM